MTQSLKTISALEIFPKISWPSWFLASGFWFSLFLGRAEFVGSFTLSSCIFYLPIFTKNQSSNKGYTISSVIIVTVIIVTVIIVTVMIVTVIIVTVTSEEFTIFIEYLIIFVTRNTLGTWNRKTL